MFIGSVAVLFVYVRSRIGAAAGLIAASLILFLGAAFEDYFFAFQLCYYVSVACGLGMLLAFGALFGMMSIEGAQVSALLLPGPMVLVFGATIAVGIASATVPDAIMAIKSIPRAFKQEKTLGNHRFASNKGLGRSLKMCAGPRMMLITRI